MRSPEKWRQLIEVCITQLEGLQPDPYKRTEHCKADISGYRELLAANEETIEKFMELKRAMQNGGERPWNTEVVAELKERCQFQYRKKENE